jgi:tRNA U34 5-carboxymethylaminomethyl modifying enzyme MnmG/GidA
MGGLIGRLSDRAATHYRMLNTSKGYSAQGLRALLDRDIYRRVMIEEITNAKNFAVLEVRCI